MSPIRVARIALTSPAVKAKPRSSFLRLSAATTSAHPVVRTIQHHSRPFAALAPELHSLNMSGSELPIFTELTAPNGLKWTQPLGGFVWPPVGRNANAGLA